MTSRVVSDLKQVPLGLFGESLPQFVGQRFDLGMRLLAPRWIARRPLLEEPPELLLEAGKERLTYAHLHRAYPNVWGAAGAGRL